MIASALRLEGITHRFGPVVAVDHFDLHVAAGEIVCLLGPSGCGKSTVLRLIAGLEPLQEGKVLLRNQIVADTFRMMPPEERGIGLVFQDFALFPHLTVAGNIAFGLRSFNPREQAIRVEAMLKQIGMTNLAQSYPHALSGGQQQRVALARALAPNPSVLLLDEPFSDLDQRLREQIRDETLQVLRRNGTATLLVTHDPNEAMFMADRIYLMREGKIAQIGKPTELYNSPSSAFAVEFFGAANSYRCSLDAGLAKTPFGPIPCDLPAKEVQLLVRPEALQPSKNGPYQAKIRSLHPLGPGMHLQLALENGVEMKAHLADLLAWKDLRLEEGGKITFDLASSRVFFFSH